MTDDADRRDRDRPLPPDVIATTRAELAALPVPDVPPEVQARWTAALAAESERLRTPDAHPRPASAGHLGGSWGRRRGRLLAAAALVVLAGTGLGQLARRPEPPPDVTRVELVALGRAAVGTLDVGALAEPGRRDACLAAVAPAAAGEALLGGRRVVLDGRPGVLLVLATGARGGLRILTVDPGCGPGGGTLLSQVVVG
jgi:hypothetical protein